MPTTKTVTAWKIMHEFQADDVQAGQLLRVLLNHWEGAYGAMLSTHDTFKGGWVEWHIGAARQAKALARAGHITPAFLHKLQMTARLVGQASELDTIRQTIEVLRTKTLKTELDDRQDRSKQWQDKVVQAVQEGSGWAHKITKERTWVPLVFSKDTGSWDTISQLQDQKALWHPLWKGQAPETVHAIEENKMGTPRPELDALPPITAAMLRNAAASFRTGTTHI
jgi:hypothetical protein